MTFTKNLQKYLKSNNFSLKELSEALDVPSSTVHGWLNGIVPKNIVTLKKISNFLNCSIDELCFGEELNLKKDDIHLESDLVISLGKNSFKVILKKISE